MKHRDDYLTITRAEIMAVLTYDPVTGIFTWKPRPGVKNQFNSKHAGKSAGKRNSSNGYIRITIMRRGYMAHRLAFVIMTGRWPTCDIDHRDTVKTNNWWTNLREATGSQNRSNTPGQSKIGLPKGVWKSRRRFSATIKQNGSNVYLGNYKTPEEAHQAYLRAAEKYYGKEYVHAA